MRAHPDVADVQEIGCEGLCSLACERCRNQGAIAAAGGIEDAVAAMRAHPGDPGVQKSACFAFARFAAAWSA